MNYDDIATKCLRCLSLDMIEKAKSGHPGIALSAAPIVYTIYSRHLVSDPNNPTWINRDRFVLSCGHASSLLYATLHLAGYPLPLDELKNFRKFGSFTPGHPELGMTPGVDATSGPLGQGLAQAVGLAIAENHLRHLYPEGERLIDHYTYCLVGDGCLEEGVASEAIALAGLFGLNRLIVLYDKNDCTLDGPLADSSKEDTKMRFEAEGWNVLTVEDGNSIDEIDKAIMIAKEAQDKPTLIICKTIIGYGSPYQNSNKAHGKAFNEEEVLATKNFFNYNHPAFEIPYEAYKAFDNFKKRGEDSFNKYSADLKEYEHKYPNDYQTFTLSTSDISSLLPTSAPIYEKGFKQASRDTSLSLLNLFAEKIPFLMGGSADVAESVKTKVATFKDYSKEHPENKNLRFGIREFAMASIQNGLLLHGGLKTYVGSFLVFADYMKAAIRMSAMERLPAIYLFSHDSIAVGEDGPTHEPIEQLTMLRSIPNVNVIRPADAIETSSAYVTALSSKETPTAIILSRQNLPLIDSSFTESQKGAYIVFKEQEKESLEIIASGSEVSLAIDVAKALLEDGIFARVISMPSMYLFDLQDQEYKNSLFSLPYEKRIFIEMGKGDMLYKYAKHVYSIDTFGKSGNYLEIMKYFGFTVNDIKDYIKKYIF